MARSKFQGRAVDTYGNSKPSIGITIYLANTTTPATVYTSQTGGTGISTTPQITSDSNGLFGFWIDTNDYSIDQLFDIKVSGLTYEDLDIFRIKEHGLLEQLSVDDHGLIYPHKEQNEVISGGWAFTSPITGSTPTKDTHIATKSYVDTNAASTGISGASVEADNRQQEYTDTQIVSLSATVREQDQRVREYADSTSSSGLSATIVEQDNRQQEYTDTQIVSLSATVREQDNRVREYADSTSSSGLSATIVEQDNRVREYVDTQVSNVESPSGNIINRAYEYTDVQVLNLSAASQEYTNTKTESLSATVREQDNRQQEYTDTQIVSLSATVREQDQRVREYAAGLESPSGNIINRAYEYTDVQVLSLSAASVEADNRLEESININLDNIQGELRTLENSAGTLFTSVSAASQEYTNTRIESLSATITEQDNRQEEYTDTQINSVSAASQEYTNTRIESLSATVFEQDNRQEEYTDTSINSVSAASQEYTNRQVSSLSPSSIEDADSKMYIYDGSQPSHAILQLDSNTITRWTPSGFEIGPINAEATTTFDYTTFSEDDPAGHISATSSTVTVSNAVDTNDANIYTTLSDTFTTNDDSWYWVIKVNASSVTDDIQGSGQQIGPAIWCLSTSFDTNSDYYFNYINLRHRHLAVTIWRFNAAYYKICLRHHYFEGAAYTAALQDTMINNLQINTDYWIKVQPDSTGNTINWWVYNNEALTNLKESGSISNIGAYNQTYTNPYYFAYSNLGSNAGFYNTSLDVEAYYVVDNTISSVTEIKGFSNRDISNNSQVIVPTEYAVYTETSSMSAASIEQDNRQQEYTDTQINSVSAASQEYTNRIDEDIKVDLDDIQGELRTLEASAASESYVDTQINSVSAASQEYTNTEIESLSATVFEQDNRVREYVDQEVAGVSSAGLSAASVEADNRVREYVDQEVAGVSSAGLSAASVEADNRVREYVDQEVAGVSSAGLSAASVEADNRLEESIKVDLDDIQGELRTLEGSAASTTYVDTQIESLSATVREQDNRQQEYTDTQIDSVSAAAESFTRTEVEEHETTYNHDLYDDKVFQLETHIPSASVHFTEAEIDHTAITNIGSNSHDVIDDRVYDLETHIASAGVHFTTESLSATIVEQDNRVREYAASLESPSGNIINRANEYTDTQIVSLSATVVEQDNRVREYVDTEVDAVSAGLLTRENMWTRQQYFPNNELIMQDGATDVAWDLSRYQMATLKVSADGTLQNPTNMPNGISSYLLIVKSYGERTVTFESDYVWPSGGSAPTLTPNGTDTISFISDGTSMYGSYVTAAETYATSGSAQEFTNRRIEEHETTYDHDLYDDRVYDLETHIASAGVHFTEAEIDHTAILNIGSNSHDVIDDRVYDLETHIASAGVHFTEAEIDHTAILNIGSNSHDVIDDRVYQLETLLASGSVRLDDGEDITLADNSEIQWDSAPDTDQDYSGDTTAMTVSANPSGFGSPLRMLPNGELVGADASAENTMPCIALACTAASSGSTTVLLRGIMRNDNWLWQPGKFVYVSEDNASLTQSVPSTTGSQVQIIGWAVDNYTVFFNPNYVLVEVS